MDYCLYHLLNQQKHGFLAKTKKRPRLVNESSSLKQTSIAAKYTRRVIFIDLINAKEVCRNCIIGQS